MTPYERNVAMRRIVVAQATERNYGHADGGRRCTFTDDGGRCCYGDGHTIATHLTVPAAAAVPPAAYTPGSGGATGVAGFDSEVRDSPTEDRGGRGAIPAGSALSGHARPQIGR
ncbi:MAG: hypothetical protein M3O32_15715 [Actinomycetota bacterium]|nr:hypothetical protein [Actinomycetota bacterium]